MVMVIHVLRILVVRLNMVVEVESVVGRREMRKEER